MRDFVTRVFRKWLGGPAPQIQKNPRVIEYSVHKIDPNLVSEGALKTCRALRNRGYDAYIVGGAVRDLLLGVKPKDFDVVTNATPEQVKRSVRRAYIIGRRFRLVHVISGDEIIECSTFRALDAVGVAKDASGRVISDNVFGEMWEDAARRDFTVNALYYDPETQRVYDYHDGFEDLQNHILRIIGEPAARYREDPVRMMRAVRIATKLHFKIERHTDKAISSMASLLSNVPAARLFDEMMKLFTSGHAEQSLISLRDRKLHRELLPQLDVILNEPEGERFLMLALHRTDERIATGKKISPAFLFATLLWPQVVKRWEAYQADGKCTRSQALYEAARNVLATQTSKLAIQNRYVADMQLLWMLQLRFERRTGKNPFTLAAHPKYRAGYDFLLLRSLLGQVPSDLVAWWDTFAQASEETRLEMVQTAEREARRTANKARAGRNRTRQAKLATDSVAMTSTEDGKQAELFEQVEQEAALARMPHHSRRRAVHSKPKSSQDTFSHETLIETSAGSLIQVQTRQIDLMSANNDGTKASRRRSRPRRRKPQSKSMHTGEA